MGTYVALAVKSDSPEIICLNKLHIVGAAPRNFARLKLNSPAGSVLLTLQSVYDSLASSVLAATSYDLFPYSRQEAN